MGLREALAFVGVAILPCGAASARPLLNGITSDRTGTMEFGFPSSGHDAMQFFGQLTALARMPSVSNHTLAEWPEANSWLPLARSHAMGLLTSVGPPEVDRATRAHRLRSMLMDAMVLQNRISDRRSTAHADTTPVIRSTHHNAHDQHVVEMVSDIADFEVGGENRDNITTLFRADRVASFSWAGSDIGGKVWRDSSIDGLLESKLDRNRRLQGAAGGKACDASTDGIFRPTVIDLSHTHRARASLVR
eukprot:SAG31_NODE_6217_length_2116_cov_3.011403_3_plen_248_part_00